MNKFNFDKIIKNVEALKRSLPIELGNETKNYFMQSFRDEAWDGKTWLRPQRRDKKGKSSRLNSATLVQTGALKRAVSNSLKERTFQRIRFEVTDVDYAGYHNNGIGQPQRQFIGDTNTLRKKQLAIIEKQVNRVWQG
jgi:hypothetical protein